MPKKKAKVDYELCACCGACAFACPISIITMDHYQRRKGCMTCYPTIQTDKCIGCGMCFNTCPVEAITMFEFDEELNILTVPASTQTDIHEIDKEKCKGCTACAKACPEKVRSRFHTKSIRMNVYIAGNASKNVNLRQYQLTESCRNLKLKKNLRQLKLNSQYLFNKIN